MWITAAVGAACGAGLPILAAIVTAGHFIVVLGHRRLGDLLPRSADVGFAVRVVYEDGRGILRDVLESATTAGYNVAQVEAQQLAREVRGLPAVAVTLEVRGRSDVAPLTSELEELDGVMGVETRDLADAGP